MSFNKDALIHKLQDENDKKENNMREIVREALYGFIEYYTQDEIERIDLRIIADKYIEENLGRTE